MNRPLCCHRSSGRWDRGLQTLHHRSGRPWTRSLLLQTSPDPGIHPLLRAGWGPAGALIRKAASLSEAWFSKTESIWVAPWGGQACQRQCAQCTGLCPLPNTGLAMGKEVRGEQRGWFGGKTGNIAPAKQCQAQHRSLFAR